MKLTMTKLVSKMRTISLFTTLYGVVFSLSAATTVINDDGSQTTIDPENEKFKQALLFKQCYPNVPPLKPTLKNDGKAEQVKLSSKRATLTQNDRATFIGDVSFKQGNREMTAETATLFQQTSILTADGNIVLADTGSTIYGSSLRANIDTKDAEILEVDYQLNGQAANGEARKIYITKSGDNILMQRSTYTECPKGDESWVLRASSIDIDNVDESAEAYNAVLYVKDVPVFYLPYFTYPTTDKRRSGLLFPSIESSLDNGFTYSQPLYLNLAPNYDLTLVPTFMQERGLQLTNKFRYLVDGQSGKLNVEYLSNDKKTDSDRSLYHWSHKGNFNDNLSFESEYTNVSDNEYFDDLNASAGSRSDDTLLQTASFNYNTESTASELEVRDFQILNDYSATTPHKVMPKLAFDAYSYFEDSNIELSVFNEITNFSHSNTNMYSAVRTHIEPVLTLPYRRPQGFAVAEFKLPMTHYSQSFNQADNGVVAYANGYKGKLKDSVTRIIPTARLATGLNFERDTSWFGSNLTQTLEPQLQYLYVPYENQNDIGIYDSSNIQQDFLSLYRDRIYGSIDRIADTNQVTLGLTSRFFDEIGSERLRFALGHIYHIEDTKTTINDDPSIENADSSDAIVSEVDFLIGRGFSFNNNVEFATNNNEVQRADAAMEYRFQSGQEVQLNYRYVANTQSLLQTSNTNLNSRINQVGSKFKLPINTQWEMGASYYYDMENSVTQDALVGIKYESCCWTLRLDYSYRLKNYDIHTEKTTYDSGPTLMFELKGLGGIGDDINNIGTSSLFKYGQPFQLRDD